MEILYGKLVFILGIANLVFLFLVFFSCRCLIGTKTYLKLLQQLWFKKFYQYHCIYWWGFMISVALHTILAFKVFGNPF